MMTLQAPHCPVPHPTFTLVSKSWPRSTSANESSGFTSSVFVIPFTTSVFEIIRLSLRARARLPQPRGFWTARPQDSLLAGSLVTLSSRAKARFHTKPRRSRTQTSMQHALKSMYVYLYI